MAAYRQFCLRQDEVTGDSIGYPSVEDIRESGAGILEFTPAKAGLDMTPANFDFESRDEKKKNHSGFSCLAGKAESFFSIRDLLTLHY